MTMRIGLVLSGGGSRGAAHAGALKAFHENGISLFHLSGVSAGAVVGAFHCAGMAPELMNQALKIKSLFRMFGIRDLAEGFIEMDRLKDTVRKYIPHDSFECLATKLTVPATNLNSGNLEFFNKGKLSDALAASCAIPLLSKPIRLNNHVYVDGGLLNNMPVEPLLHTCDYVIGINLNYHEKINHLEGWRSIAKRSLELVIRNNTVSHLDQCDFVINMHATNKYSAFDFRKTDALFEIGYHETRLIIPKLLKSIETAQNSKALA